MSGCGYAVSYPSLQITPPHALLIDTVLTYPSESQDKLSIQTSEECQARIRLCRDGHDFGKWWTAPEPSQSSWRVNIPIKKTGGTSGNLSLLLRRNNYLNIFQRWEELSQQLGWALQRARAAGSGYNWAEIGLPWQWYFVQSNALRWLADRLIPPLEKRLKRGPSIRLPTIKSLIGDIIPALRDNKMFLSARHDTDLNVLNIIWYSHVYNNSFNIHRLNTLNFLV